MNNGKLTLSLQFVRIISKAPASIMYKARMEVKFFSHAVDKDHFQFVTEYTNTKIGSSIKQESLLCYLMLQKLCSKIIAT